MDRDILIRGAKLELARREFFLLPFKSPGFYKEDRQYLVELCNEFQDFIRSDEKVMIVNEPPRHGKSRTAGLLVEWVLGNNQKQKIMTGSYNETLSTMFSKTSVMISRKKRRIRTGLSFQIFSPGYRLSAETGQ